MSAKKLRIRGCFHTPPHDTFTSCPDNDAWMFPGSNAPVPDPEGEEEANEMLARKEST